MARTMQRHLEITSADDLGIVDGLAQLSFLIHSTLANCAADHDLSIVQTRLLGILRDREPTMQELAGRLSLDKSSASGLIDRAELRGLVQRFPSATDRREVRVRLTPKGRKVIRDVGGEFEHQIARITGELSSSDRRRLSGLATQLVRAGVARIAD